MRIVLFLVTQKSSNKYKQNRNTIKEVPSLIVDYALINFAKRNYLDLVSIFGGIVMAKLVFMKCYTDLNFIWCQHAYNLCP